MSVLTNWGYKLTTVDKMPDLLNADEFNTMTANKYSGDVRIATAITAAQSAIRNYVGWHLSTNLECEAEYTLQSRNISLIDHDMMIQLPAKHVTEIKSVIIGATKDSEGKWTGTIVSTYTCETNGILRLYDVNMNGLERYSRIVIDYAAGLPVELTDGIKELVAHRVTHALVSPGGVQSESAGGVAVTYNSNWINSARATALPDDNKEVLAPYRLQGVF
jgi:glyceraldehyde-3-phosphate dehydrogenase/erythrose-4-phosphate dehydrogenase